MESEAQKVMVAIPLEDFNPIESLLKDRGYAFRESQQMTSGESTWTCQVWAKLF